MYTDAQIRRIACAAVMVGDWSTVELCRRTLDPATPGHREHLVRGLARLRAEGTRLMSPSMFVDAAERPELELVGAAELVGTGVMWVSVAIADAPASADSVERRHQQAAIVIALDTLLR